MAYENFYNGTYNREWLLYGESRPGYLSSFSRLGSPTSITTANQIAEVTSRLNEGLRVVEVGTVSPEIFETIPKEQFKEINRLTKLVGAEATVHAPIIDPAGFTQDGWSESQRQAAERRLISVIERAQEINPAGNVPITIHATVGVPSTHIPTKKGPSDEEVIPIMNQETGQITATRLTKKYNPLTKEEVILSPKEQMEEDNRRRWHNFLSSFAYENIRATDFLEGSVPALSPVIEDLAKGKIKEEQLSPEQQRALVELRTGQAMYENLFLGLKQSFNDAIRLWPKEFIEKNSKVIFELKKRLGEFESSNLIEVSPLDATKKFNECFSLFNDLIKKQAPQIYVPVDDFAREKSKETITNIALYAFKKFGEKAPIISLENIFPGTVFARGKDLADLIKASREAFIEKAKREGIDEEKAKQFAEKLIGATWDVGHINILRKYGFEKEDIVKETKEIAPFVKHVHLTDNFGFSDSHLPPGLGEVPIKGILKELEKQGYSGKEIVEAGAFVEHFKSSPLPYILEALESPLYSMQMQPFWSQAYGIPQGYWGGYGLMLPEQHMGIYGSGFASLPLELGGSVRSQGQRFSGTPME